MRADIRDQRGLQFASTKRVDGEDLQRIPPAGQRDLEFEHRTRHTHIGIVRQGDEKTLREPLTRTPHDNVGFTDEALRRLRKFRQRGTVDQIDRGTEGHAERNREYRDDQTSGLFAQLRQEQHPPDSDRAAHRALRACPGMPRRLQSVRFEYQYPIGGVRRRLRVRDQDPGPGIGFDLRAQKRQRLRGGARIEIAGRLVGEQQTRPVHERTCDRDPLQFAAGQLAGHALTQVHRCRPLRASH